MKTSFLGITFNRSSQPISVKSTIFERPVRMFRKGNFSTTDENNNHSMHSDIVQRGFERSAVTHH